MDTKGEFIFKVRGYECDPNGRATFANLCNYMQEAAGLQASDCHFAKQDFDAKGENISWIITRMRVMIDRYPNWWDEVRVLTFPRSGRKIVINRDYELYVGDERIGGGTSDWMLLNLETRKLVEIPAYIFAAANDERPPSLGDAVFSRLRWSACEHAHAVRITVRRYDLDFNGHVNNVRYMAWMQEALPESAGPVRDFEIAFKSETRLGEDVVAEAVQVEPGVYMAHVADINGKDHAVAKIVCS